MPSYPLLKQLVSLFFQSRLYYGCSVFHYYQGKIEKTNIENSFLSSVGKSIVPVIKPLGYDWKIGIALLSSFAAREVFVSTLATLYQIKPEDEGTIFEKIKSQKNPETNQPVYTMAVGISLLLFYAFALQCMSTLAAMKKKKRGVGNIHYFPSV